MRIGFDVDGVFAQFNDDYINRVIRVAGRDLFPPRPFDIPVWNYPELYGYSTLEVTNTWRSIERDPTFWLNLQPYWDAMDLLERIRLLSDHHDVYFISSRPGIQTKKQTEVWLATHSGDFEWMPTVLISSAKGLVAKALVLDAYVDDYDKNVVDVNQQASYCLTYLLDRPWNRELHWSRRISSVGEMLDDLKL